MTFAEPVRETCLVAALSLSGTIPTGNGNDAVRRLPLALGPDAFDIPASGSFSSNLSIAAFHDVSVQGPNFGMCKMMTAADCFDIVRPRLLALIAYEKRKTGSACDAVRSAARKIGATTGWVRRIIGRYDRVTIHAHLYINLQEACERIGAGAGQSAHKVADLVTRMKQRRTGLSA